MSKFFVGQRVRVVWVEDPTKSGFIGREGHISEIRKGLPGAGWDPIGLDFCPIVHEIQGDSWCVVGFGPDQLEPILPEGSAPSVYTFQQLMDELQEAVA